MVGAHPHFSSCSEKWARRARFFFFKGTCRLAETQKQTIESRAKELLEPLVAAEGLELVDLEYVREREGWVLRLFIDKPGGGVGLDECTQVSRAVDTVLDVEDFIDTEYNLE